MEPLAPDDYNRYSTKPVPFDPWDPKTKIVAANMLANLEQILSGLEVELLHMGSTALGIAGKNEVEVYVYPAQGLWETVTQTLTNTYGEPGHRDKDFIRYDTTMDGYPIELIQVRGYSGKVNKAVFRYLAAHPDLCEEYVAIKKQYRFSKREYMIHKEQFFQKLTRQIPDDYVTS